MNYGQLKKQITEWAHRDDLEDKMPEFIANVSQRLGRRLGVMPAPLVKDTDTNSLLTTHSAIYLYGALREVMIWTNNEPGAGAFDRLFTNEVRELNINYEGADWTACGPPIMGNTP